MEILNSILDFLYGWINDSWLSFFGIILAVTGFILTGFGLIETKRHKNSIGKTVMVAGIIMLLYLLGMVKYDPGLASGNPSKDYIVKNVDDYRNAGLFIRLYDKQFNVYDRTSSNELHFGNRMEGLDAERVEKISLKHLDTGNIYREYTIVNNEIRFSKLPSGKYEALMKYDGYIEHLSTINLDPASIYESETDKNGWNYDIYLMKSNSESFYPFSVRLLDADGNPLTKYEYGIGMQKNYHLTGLYTDDNGFLKYDFEGKLGSQFYLSYNSETEGSTVFYTKVIEFNEENKVINVVIDYNEEDKNEPGLTINVPGLLKEYYVDFGYGLELYDSSDPNEYFKSVSSSGDTEIYDVIVHTDINLQEKKINLSIPSGAGSSIKPLSDHILQFKASKGSYILEVYDSRGVLINEKTVDVNRSGDYQIDLL